METPDRNTNEDMHIHASRGEEADYNPIEQWAKQHLL